MNAIRATRAYLPVGLLAVVLAGCSDPYAGRMEVSGKVILEGQPLDNGSIEYLPLEGQDTRSGSPITKGEYKIPRSHGLKAGKYLVRITSGDGKTPSNAEAAQPGGSTNIISWDRIPPEWNVESKQEKVVKANESNQFDFDIPQANKPRKR